MNKCAICNKEGVYKIRGEKIYYCQKHAEEFFEKDSLEQIKQIKLSLKQAQILKKYLEK